MKRFYGIVLLAVAACTVDHPADARKPPAAARDTKGPAMEQSQIIAAVRKHLEAGGITNAAQLSVTDASYPLDHDESSWRFFIAKEQRPNPPKDWKGQEHFVAVDVASGKVYWKDESAAAAYLQAMGYPGHPDRLLPEEVFAAWYGLTRGVPAPMVFGQSGNTPPEVRRLVSRPATQKKDGLLVTTAWTSELRDHRMTRHTLTVHPDGHIVTESVAGADLVKK
ncbi:MAG TPA: hypothetical protein VH877_15440 [Polyangia bacterium]|jgi:hypothetical protein|nr:hypothetical protein [Polyangia bacterium]